MCASSTGAGFRAVLTDRGLRAASQRPPATRHGEEVMKLNDILGELGVDLGQWKGDALTARSALDVGTRVGVGVDTPADAAR